MLVVPIEKDRIHTKENQDLEVVSYTNYKENGPAVYVKNADGDLHVVYFWDIVKINGVEVDYNKSSKIFTSLGRIKRRQHLPQPDDKVTAHVAGKNVVIDVEGVKLKSKTHGQNKGMFIYGQDRRGNTVYMRLRHVDEIISALGDDAFDKNAAKRHYSDYFGV